MYEFNNQIYSYEDLLAIAQSKGYSFDELLSKNPEIKKAGKTTPPQKEDRGATVGAIQAPDTGSILEYTSSELQEIQNKFGEGKFTTAQRPAFEEYQKTGKVNKELLPAIEQEDDRFGFLGSLGLSFAKIPVNIRKQADNLRTFILDPIVQLSNPSMTNQERKEFIEKIPSAFGLAMPGAGISGAVDVSEKSKQILQNIQNKQMETSEKSLSKAFEKGDYIDSAFLAADGLIQSLPSIGFSLAGPSAIFVHGALIAGEKYADELEQSPKSTAEAIGYNALAIGAIEAGSDFLFRGLASNAGIIAKQGTATQAKEYLSNGFNRIAKKLLIGPGEGLTEVSQNIASKYLDEWILNRKFKFSEIKNELIDDGVVGWLMGSGTSMVSSMAGSNKTQRAYAEGLLMPEEIKQKLNKYSEEYNSIAEQYTAEENEEAKKVLDQRLAEMETEVAILSNKYKTALYAMDADETSEYAKNKDQIFKKQRALDKTTTETGKNLLTSQINELNKSNNKILQDAAARQLEKTIETVKKSSPKLGIETEILSKKDIFEQYGPKAAESDGFFKDKKIIINKEVASEVGAVNVAAHELLHGVLYTTLQNNPDTAIVLGDLLAKEIIKLNPDQIANSMLKRRLLLYKDDSKALQGEELLALFSDAVATGDIKYNENIFTKIGDGIRRILQNLGWKKIKFNSGKDVYNFIRDYNADIAKGGIRKKLIEQARKGFEGALIDKGINIGKEINEEVAKFSKSEASDKVQQIYNSQGVAGAMDIIERFNPIVNKLVNKYRDVPGFEYQILKDEIETGQRGILDMIMAYNPEKNKGVPLAAYINKFLPARMIEVANRNLGTEFTLDVTEAKGVTDTATEEQIEAAEEAITADEIKSLRKEIGLPEELITKVKNSVIKAFGTRLPNPQDPKFRLELQRIFRTELKKPMAKFVGKQEAYESFLRDNFKAIYDKMPLSLILKRFKEFADPVLDENGKQKRERTAEGNKIFVKKKLTPAEFVKYFLGSDVGRSTQGTRKTAIVEGIAEEIAFDATMEVLQDPTVIQKYQDIAGITGEVLPENFKSLIAKQVDRAENFKFSKSIIETAKIEYNLEQQSLADILNKNNLNTLSNKYPLISDAIINEASPTNIKFSLSVEDANILKEYNITPYKLENINDVPNYIRDIRKIAKIFNTDDYKILNTSVLQFTAKSIKDKATRDELAKQLNILKKEGVLAGRVTVGRNKITQAFGTNLNSLGKAFENGKVKEWNEKHTAVGDKLWDDIKKAIDSDITLAIPIMYFLSNSINEVTNPHRMWAPLVAYEINAGTIYYEHAMQSSNAYRELMRTILAKEDFQKKKQEIKENYKIIAIDELSNKKLEKAGFGKKFLKEWKNWWQRYFNPDVAKINGGIDPRNIIFPFNQNKTAADLFKISLPDGTSSKKYSKSLNKSFNEILQASTGIKWTENYSPSTAKMLARGKGKGNLFIPYSAEDFVGLLYTTLSKGKIGDQQMEWYNENLIRPFSRGIQAYEAEKQRAMREWSVLKQRATKDVPGGLKKQNESGFTNEESLRMYIWQRQGMEIPNIQKGEVNKAIRAVRNNKKFKEFANTLMSLNPEGYPEPSNNWIDGDITSDLVGYVNGTKRAEFLTQWKENVDEIFSEKNKTKLRALYGDRYVEALEDMLFRMERGTNRSKGTNKQTRAWMDWVNNSVGTIMFFNARSAVLQTLSTVNFINFSDNNPINAAAALANFGQYRQDFVDLFNSDFLKQRRSGLQIDINADEIAKATKGNEKSPRAILRALLQFGFTPTQIADSFAIAAGGATFYRNRINKYIKEGLNKTEAEKKAFTDFQEIAEETQQSARPDRISMEQASSLGRVILAFANTPMQYARLQKKAFLDLINSRGDWKTNTSKIIYYGVIQNVIFSALQQALFALMFDDEDEAEKKTRYYKIGNASLDTLLRGVGVGGAALATVKNIIIEIIDQAKSKRPDYTQAAIAATSISPPINSKLRKLLSAGRAFTYKQSREKIFTEGFSLENPALLAAGQVLSAAANIPADRIVIKADHLYTAMQPETELWQAIALSLGWSEWDLGMIEKQTNNKQLTTKELKNLMKRKNIFKDLMKR